MEEEVGFAQHSQQRVMTGPSMFTGVVSFKRPLLMAIALEDRRIQVQGVAVAALRQALHLPFRERFEQALHLENRSQILASSGGAVASTTCVRRPSGPYRFAKRVVRGAGWITAPSPASAEDGWSGPAAVNTRTRAPNAR